MMCKSLNSTLRTVLGRLHLSDTNWWRSGILSVMAIFRQLSRLSTLILADLAVTDRMGHRKHEQWQTSEGRLPLLPRSTAEKTRSNRFPEQRLDFLAEVVLQAFGAVVADVHQAHSAATVDQNQRGEAFKCKLLG